MTHAQHPLPLAPVGTALIDVVLGSVVLGTTMAVLGIAPPTRLLLLPVFVLLTVFTALAIALWFTALNALYRDVGQLAPFLLQLWFFATPVLYTRTGVHAALPRIAA